VSVGGPRTNSAKGAFGGAANYSDPYIRKID
jgi:hypothetical protein